VDGHAEILGRSGEEAADVGVGSEPKGPAMDKAGDESLCHKQAAAIAGGQGGRLVEERPRVEDLEHLRVRMPHDRQVAPGESGEALRELTTARSVDPLEESPVATGGQGQVVVVGKAVWPVPAEDSQRQVLVEDDHAGGVLGSVGGVVGVTAEERVGDNIGVEGRLKFVRKVTGGHPTEQLFPFVAKARVPGPASSPAFLEEFFTDAHRLHCARPWPRPRPNLNYRAVQPGPKQRADPDASTHTKRRTDVAKGCSERNLRLGPEISSSCAAPTGRARVSRKWTMAARLLASVVFRRRRRPSTRRRVET
jgi:hypothetical protein